ncbi:MAG: tetratricopeptide repeat protein, partial [Deltaproteobacteria bacterium]|nr:tetratricopeptide repeat protein [Deltaproteobacteria bacterium]
GDRTKDWRDDYSLYSSSLASRPGSARLHSHLSKIMIERKDLSGAKTHIMKSLEIYPESADSWNNLGAILLNEKEYDAAFEHLMKAVTINPLLGSAWNNLCGYYFIRSDFEKACDACERAEKLGFRTPHNKKLRCF